MITLKQAYLSFLKQYPNCYNEYAEDLGDVFVFKNTKIANDEFSNPLVMVNKDTGNINICYYIKDYFPRIKLIKKPIKISLKSLNKDIKKK